MQRALAYKRPSSAFSPDRNLARYPSPACCLVGIHCRSSLERSRDESRSHSVDRMVGAVPTWPPSRSWVARSVLGAGTIVLILLQGRL
ncbi:DUF3309 family protein [Comamonas terrigena]|uniref:DUF3309 family protein n=1 Tax=Comamonas terrigena TaxID=32013 RepID=UPI003F8303B7